MILGLPHPLFNTLINYSFTPPNRCMWRLKPDMTKLTFSRLIINVIISNLVWPHINLSMRIPVTLISWICQILAAQHSLSFNIVGSFKETRHFNSFIYLCLQHDLSFNKRDSFTMDQARGTLFCSLMTKRTWLRSLLAVIPWQPFNPKIVRQQVK